MAVNYFFMLSGFGLTYAEKNGRPKNDIDAGKTNLYYYAFAKVKKIYLLYLITMLSFIPWQVYIYYFKDGRSWIYTSIMTSVKLVSVVTLLQSVTGRSSFTHALNSVGWFLSTLFVLYMFYPNLKKWNKKYINTRRTINCIVMALLLLYVVVVKLFYFIESHSFFDKLVYCSPLTRVIPFTLGILICDRLFLDDIKDNRKQRNTIYEILLVGVMTGWFLFRDAIAQGNESVIIGIIDIIIVMYAIAIFSKEKGAISKYLNNKKLVSLGNITMYIYLIHYPVAIYI